MSSASHTHSATLAFSIRKLIKIVLATIVGFELLVPTQASAQTETFDEIQQEVISQENKDSESPTADQEFNGEAKIEEVFVTGSLLPKGDFVSKAPIATITSSQFEMSNAVNVENLINTMPQVVGGADRSSSFGQGIATANLRGLGENRTLVLINSRRFVPTFPDGGTVDLNFIPVGLIDRVEILTGGASAAYGSDAMAGVINFILKEETDGWEFNAGAEITEQGDSEIFNFNLTNGGSFAGGKGSYLVHADYLEREPLYFTDRNLTKAGLIDSVGPNGDLGLQNAPNRFPITPTAGMLVPDFLGGRPNCCFASFNNGGDISLNQFTASDTGPEFWGFLTAARILTILMVSPTCSCRRKGSHSRASWPTTLGRSKHTLTSIIPKAKCRSNGVGHLLDFQPHTVTPLPSKTTPSGVIKRSSTSQPITLSTDSSCLSACSIRTIIGTVLQIP